MSYSNYAVGISFLLVVVFLWTLSSFLTQNLFVNGYNKPFLVTYLNTSTFTLYLLPHAVRHWRHSRTKLDDSRGAYTSLPPSGPRRTSREVRRSHDEQRSAHSMSPPPVPAEPTVLPPLTTRETAHLAAIFCLLWFVANWTVNASLEFTSVASSTILASMSGFFTLAIGRAFGVETFTLAKLGAVIISFLGVLLVSLSDSSAATPSSSTSAILGDLLALLSALFYALYVTFLKVRTQHESRVNAQLFFGFVGLFNALGLWPLGLLLHFLGWERVQLPGERMAWAALGVNMIITLVSDYLYVLAMLKTTPLIVTIGLSLTIPLAVLGDAWLGRRAHLQTLLGATLVLSGFAAVGWEGAQNDAQEQAVAVTGGMQPGTIGPAHPSMLPPVPPNEDDRQ